MCFSAFAICVGELIAFSLKVNVLFILKIGQFHTGLANHRVLLLLMVQLI